MYNCKNNLSSDFTYQPSTQPTSKTLNCDKLTGVVKSALNNFKLARPDLAASGVVCSLFFGLKTSCSSACDDYHGTSLL